MAATPGHPRARTGIRLVLTNAADPSRADAYSAWYDDYERAIIRPGLLANAFRFENANAAGTASDPRFAAVYDIVTPDPASAWPDTENSANYPTYLFNDPRSRLVVPALRASYALTGSLEIDHDHRALTGVHIILSDGSTTPSVRNGLLLSSKRVSSTVHRVSESSKGLRSRRRGSRSSRPISKTR